jgi:hypothetical protein
MSNRRFYAVSAACIVAIGTNFTARAQAPVTTFDGKYSGWATLSRNPTGEPDCRAGPFPKTLTISNGVVSYPFNAPRAEYVTGSVNSDGNISGFTATFYGGNKLTANIKGNVLTGEVGNTVFGYSIILNRTQ